MYHSCSGVKLSKYGRRSGGIVVFIKDIIQDKFKRVHKSCIYAIFYIVDKSVFCMTQDVLLCFAYLPPEGSTFYLKTQVEDKNGVSLLQKEIECIRSEFDDDLWILILGDLNARCGKLLDYIEDDSVDHLPLLDTCTYEYDGFCLDRVTQDESVNNFGISLVQMCCTLIFIL